MDFDSLGKIEGMEDTMLMEYVEENNQCNVEFCPVEHPVEPEEEDRPVKCPVPVSSSLIHKNYATEKSKQEWVKQRASSETPVYPPPRHIRNVRTRHNSFVEHGNNNNNNTLFTRSSHDEDENTSRRSNVTFYRLLSQQIHHFHP